MVSVVKPGSCLANSTVLMMHLVESSLNLSHRSTSKDTRRSELLVCGGGENCGKFYMTEERCWSSRVHQMRKNRVM